MGKLLGQKPMRSHMRKKKLWAISYINAIDKKAEFWRATQDQIFVTANGVWWGQFTNAALEMDEKNQLIGPESRLEKFFLINAYANAWRNNVNLWALFKRKLAKNKLFKRHIIWIQVPNFFFFLSKRMRKQTAMALCSFAFLLCLISTGWYHFIIQQKFGFKKW